MLKCTFGVESLQICGSLKICNGATESFRGNLSCLGQHQTATTVQAKQSHQCDKPRGARNILEDSFLVRWSLWFSDTQLGLVFSLPLPLMRQRDDKHRHQLCHRTWCWWYSHPPKLRSVGIFLVCFCFEQLPIFYLQQKGWLCFRLW